MALSLRDTANPKPRDYLIPNPSPKVLLTKGQNMDEIAMLQQKNQQMIELIRALRSWSFGHGSASFHPITDPIWHEADAIIAKADLDIALKKA